MKTIVAVLITIVFLIQLACAAQESQNAIELAPYDFSYQSYAQLLEKHVRDGLVDYDALSKNRDRLDSLVVGLSRANLTNATRDQRLAFFTNAYNIITLRSIVDVYPVGSIKDIDGVWDKQKWQVAGEQLTLNKIEHEILRKQFDEPRIHVAINCASIGCPPLLELPYYPDRIDSLLTMASQRFANSIRHNQIDSASKIARLSAIFDWFGDDFIAAYYEADRFSELDKKKGAALSFILAHLAGVNADSDSFSKYTVEYMEYDWTLNDLAQ